MLRRLAWVLLPLLVLLLAGWFLLAAVNLAPLASWLGSTLLGRPLVLETLRVSPGRWVQVQLAGARLDGLPGGAPLAELTALTAEIEAFSLLRGPLVVRRLEARGARLLLERDPTGRGNWVLGSGEPAENNSRTTFPTLLDAGLRESTIDYRTRSGKLLRFGLEQATLFAPGPAAEARLTAHGRYNDTPLGLEALLGSYPVLRDLAKPFPTDITLRSGTAALRFQGTMTDPLNIDGAEGRLALDTPDLTPLVRLAGEDAPARSPALRLDGTLQKQGDRWHWSALKGALGDAAVSGQSLTLVEGHDGGPDAITAVLDFDRLDLDRLLAAEGGGQDADVSLAVDRAPGTLLSLRLTARRLDYGPLAATDARLVAALRPGHMAVDELALSYLGGRVTAKGQVGHERIEAQAEAAGVQAEALRRLLGLGALPLGGRLDARFALDAAGATLNAAARVAHASAVVRMQGGSVGRRVLELVSTDIRGLFRTAEGSSPVSCLLAVVDLRGGRATVAPLRLRAGDGTVHGNGTVDLRQRRIDLVIGTEPATTGTLALDVPVRVSGSLDDPSIRPAAWSTEGRAALDAPNAVGRLLPELRPFARQSPCLTR